MNLTREHVVAAVEAGLALTDPEQDLLQVYRRHGNGLSILRAILENISTGQIVLSSPQPPQGAELPDAIKQAMGQDPEDLTPGGTNPDDD
jgi:hypothetical protein